MQRHTDTFFFNAKMGKRSPSPRFGRDFTAALRRALYGAQRLVPVFWCWCCAGGVVSGPV